MARAIVMRILDKSSLTLGLPELGFLSRRPGDLRATDHAARRHSARHRSDRFGQDRQRFTRCLNYINKPDRKIITVEDPVEYQMNGINQVQVNADIGMTFPGGVALDAAPGAEHHHDR